MGPDSCTCECTSWTCLQESTLLCPILCISVSTLLQLLMSSARISGGISQSSWRLAQWSHSRIWFLAYRRTCLSSPEARIEMVSAHQPQLCTRLTSACSSQAQLLLHFKPATAQAFRKEITAGISSWISSPQKQSKCKSTIKSLSGICWSHPPLHQFLTLDKCHLCLC